MLTKSDLQKMRILLDENVVQKKKDDSDNFATKENLKTLKDDLKNLVIKDDLKQFATKEDLKDFIVKDDLNKAVEEIIEFIGISGDKLKKDLSEIKEILVDHQKKIDSHEIRIKNLEVN